jgi:hypothetical protein
MSNGTLIKYSIENEENLQFWKPKCKQKSKKKVLSFRLVDAKSENQDSIAYYLRRRIDMFLLLGSNKRLYLSSSKAAFNLVEIDGKYDNGFLLDANKICAFTKGIVHIIYFTLDPQNNEYKIGKNLPMNVHYDDITCVFSQESYAVLTASKDASVKMFFVSPRVEVASIDFERTNLEIKNFTVIGNKHAISFEESK